LWRGETHTKVSAEAIRWAIRYYWQKVGYSVNRVWKDNPLPNEDNPQWQDPNFNAAQYIDDDLLGFMEFESPKKEPSDQSQSETSGKNNQTKKSPPKGTHWLNYSLASTQQYPPDSSWTVVKAT
jgi:CRISPR-associated protein Cst2